jgi:hypothetical protein
MSSEHFSTLEFMTFVKATSFESSAEAGGVWRDARVITSFRRYIVASET